MRTALQRGEGLVVVTGPPGTGKTTLIEQFHAELDRDSTCIARLNSTRLEAEDLLRMICLSLDLDIDVHDKASLVHRLEQFLFRQAGAGFCTVLLVDEAQDLRVQALEELRLLGNLQLNARPVLQIFLLGQQQLLDRLQLAEMKPLFQRLGAVCQLAPLSMRETRAYIEHRLRRAGWDGDPAFTERTHGMIYRFSEGFPRQINRVCDRLLRYGGVEKKHTLECFDTLRVLRALLEETAGATREQSFGVCLDILNASWSAAAESEDASRAEADAWTRFLLEEKSEWVAAGPVEDRAADQLEAARAPNEDSRRSLEPLQGSHDGAGESPLTAPGQAEQPVHASRAADPGNRLPQAGCSGTGVIDVETRRRRAKSTAQPVASRVSASQAAHAAGVRAALDSGVRLVRQQAARLHAAARAKAALWQSFKARCPCADRAPLLSSGSGAAVVTLFAALLLVWGEEQSDGFTAAPAPVKVVRIQQAVARDSIVISQAGPDTSPQLSIGGFTAAVKPADERTERSAPLGADGPSGPVPVSAGRSLEAAMSNGDTVVSGVVDDKPVQGGVREDRPAQTSDVTGSVSRATHRAAVAWASDYHASMEPAGAAGDPMSESGVFSAMEATAADRVSEPRLSAERERAQLVVDPVVPTAPPPAETATAAQQVNQLMNRAEQAIEDDRLTVPAENNALHYYRQVLDRVPDHPGARAGTRRIAERYINLAQRTLDADRIDKARTYAARGLMVAPGNAELLSLKKRVTAREASLKAQAEMAAMEAERISQESQAPVEQQRPKRFLEKLKAFFESAEPAEAP